MSEALATQGLWLLIAGALLAGVVRGFAGFGTAMIYLPFAAQVLGPFEALTTLIIKDLTAPLIHVPRALRDGTPGDLLRLGLGALIALPFGVWVLSLVAPEIFRWGVSLIALTLLTLLILGVRYRGQITNGILYGVGALGGFLAGAVGLPGPPIIMLYMASTLPAAAVRANLTLYLIMADVLLLAVLAWNGFLVASAVALGVLMILPYLLGNWVGALLFRPDLEDLYRRVAYAIIAASAILGLPIWDG
ncbi:MAG: sulfite exporter TauE/SafE family protein [Paracoccaceae bacterium]|nr:sulfite exporter TauE/SafE family protein [Paracoccaceae bacterium]